MEKFPPEAINHRSETADKELAQEISREGLGGRTQLTKHSEVKIYQKTDQLQLNDSGGILVKSVTSVPERNKIRMKYCFKWLLNNELFINIVDLVTKNKCKL